MRLVSHVGRAIRRSGMNTTEFARESGIARSTLEKLIGNHFSEIRRDTIERLAARLGIDDLTELFSLQVDDQDFLAPFLARRSVTFVFGTHDVTDAGRIEEASDSSSALRTTIDMWDFRAQTELLNFLRRHVPEIRDEMVFFSKQSFGEKERQDVLELIRRHNTVIVGSPKVNPACEAALCALYRGRQAGAGRESGPRLRLSEGERLRGSVLGIEGLDEVGAADAREKKILTACHYAGVGSESVDAGLLFDVFRPLGTAEEVSLVIAAGVSGCGTNGAIRSLVEDPPRAEQLTPGVPMERAVEVRYTKPTESLRDDRQIVAVSSVQ